MPFRPFSWIGLECILHYMEANKRLETAQHCPAFQKFEKRIPLRIDFLQLQDCAVTINQTTYHLEIKRKCPHDTSSELFDKGIQYDLDQYCLPYSSPSLELTPGDIFFTQKITNFDKKRREIIEGRERELKTIRFYLDNLRRFDSHSFSTGENLKSDLQAQLKILRESLKDFHARKKNVRHPCARELQLTIWKDGLLDLSRVQRGVHNMKLRKAMKQLNTFLFAGRCRPIQVQKLMFGPTLQVLRLPKDIKLHIKELEINLKSERFCKAIQRILTKDSFPLDFVNVRFNQREHFTPHEMITTAKKVQISWGPYTLVHHDIFSELECLELVMMDDYFIAEEYFGLIQDWLRTRKRVGTRYTFFVHRVVQREIIDGVRNRFNGLPTNKGGVVIPMGDDSGARIHVSYNGTQFLAGTKLVIEVLAAED